MSENQTGRHGPNINDFWPAADADRGYHWPELGFRTGVGGDGREYMVVEFDDDVNYAYGDVLCFKEGADGWLVTNDRDAGSGGPAGVMHQEDLGIARTSGRALDGMRGWIQIKGRHPSVLKEAATALKDASSNEWYEVHAANDGAITVDASATPSFRQVVGRLMTDIPANGTRADILLALPWA